MQSECAIAQTILSNQASSSGDTLFRLPPKNAPAPSLFFNHCYIVLEPTTYQAIITSEFIKSTFADGGEITVNNINASWIGGYFFGEETYVEFYDPDKNRQGDPHNQVVGNSGIIWGIEAEEESAAWQYALQRTDSTFGSTTATILMPRKLGAAQMLTPWAYFTTAQYKQQNERRFKSWTMEYHKTYLKNLHPDCKKEEDGMTRKQYLMRRYSGTKLLKNITSVCVALDSLEIKRFVRELKASNYAVREGKREIKADAHGFHIRLVPATQSRQGIIELRMKLNRQVPHQTYSFGGNSVLILDGEEAVWTF
jgi:hypothetical protein